jgi:hypothetical protein
VTSTIPPSKLKKLRPRTFGSRDPFLKYYRITPPLNKKAYGDSIVPPFPNPSRADWRLSRSSFRLLPRPNEFQTGKRPAPFANARNSCIIFAPVMLYSQLKVLSMPGNENPDQTNKEKPDANKASKQQAHIDRNEDMGDVDPKYRNEVDKALRKDVDSNKDPDDVKTNTSSGGKRDQ